MRPVRVIAIGNPMASDDGAAIEAARRLRPMPDVEVVFAGRPGAGLLDLLDPSVPTVLMDVVRMGAASGAIVEVPLRDLTRASLDGKPLSSHGLGVTHAIQLAEALERPLPRGIFVGIGGRRFDAGTERSREVELALDDLVAAAEGAVDALREV